MRIKKIHIQNYKSLVDFELDSPPPFCAFVGPNASGKSNVFEALEFTNYVYRFGQSAAFFFNGFDIKSFNPITVKEYEEEDITFYFGFNKIAPIKFYINFPYDYSFRETINIGRHSSYPNEPDILNLLDKNYLSGFIDSATYEGEYELLADNFSRIFVGNSKLVRINQSSNKLSPDASNLSQIIGRIFQDERKKEDFIEWVQILIPEFQNIEVKKSNIDGSFEFFVYEKSSDKPFPKHLISDGTYNILALMAAVYQSSEPQFLCIEEPENGLHPHAIKLLVEFFREKCEDEGHHIWLNTHSPTLVRGMAIDEIVLVNKINGQTRAKRVTNMGDIDINTDEAWLTNALGGGTLWSK